MIDIRPQSYFTALKEHDEQLERLGLLAERYFADDPNPSLPKFRQRAECLAQSGRVQGGPVAVVKYEALALPPENQATR
ncbi:hypothetical protein [Accumulibacter sp.]|uniref:hypothetical protein n=1 Tax=Accumulibacter sp. TaxID=2053492 RepID=UPI0028C40C89|nr:hypothetical protein [Accumulibacter sp.]